MHTGKGEEVRYYSDLMYVKYKAPYCWLYFWGGSTFRAEIPLTFLLENLPEKPFVKCNRAEFINLCYYGGYNKNTLEIMIEDGTKIKMSTRNIAKFKEKKANLKYFSPPCPNCSNCNKQSCRNYWLFSIETDMENKKTE